MSRKMKGTQKICLSYCPTKTLSVKSILSAMNLDRFEKSPREILNPEIQKGTQKICLSYCPTKTLSVKSILSAMNLDRFEKSPREILNPEIQKDLLVLEEQEGSVHFKFGVLYAKDGQLTDDEMFSNEAGSESFQKLLNLLGDTITLKSWIGYRGGLDTKNQLQNKDLLSIPIRAKPLIILEFIITNAKIPKVHKTLIIKLPKV